MTTKPPDTPPTVRSFVFEATQACNHDCLHCYNVWKNPAPYPAGALPTERTLAMLEKMLAETGAALVSISGGEPLLRSDIFEIVDFLSARRVDVNLLTNGSLLDEPAIARLCGGKVSLFELPLLSARREIHDRMSGSSGAFDCATTAIASLKAAGQTVVCVFVATLMNLPTWRETAELAIALGADGILFNRFNPGGRGAANIKALQAPPQQLAQALDVAWELVEAYGIAINCSIPMPPCLFDHARWPKLGFGFCAAGTEKAYYTLDPLGNVRPCNHSATILGNILETSFAEMVDSPAMRQFKAARPAVCTGCAAEELCLGGCKASAEVCFGSIWQADPFLSAFGCGVLEPSSHPRAGSGA